MRYFSCAYCTILLVAFKAVVVLSNTYSEQLERTLLGIVQVLVRVELF